MIKQWVGKSISYPNHSWKWPSASLLLGDEENDIHEIGKLGERDEASSHHLGRVWMFLAKAIWFQIDDSDFLSISLIENWVFYIAMISIGRRKYSHQLTDFKFKGEVFCNYFFIFCNVALGKMVSVAANIQTLNYKNIKHHLHLKPEKSHR